MKNNSSSWILIRGLGRDGRHWGAFPALMQAAFQHDEVICLDLPGTGDYCDLKSPSTITHIVDWLRNHNAMKLSNNPINLIAISMGGMIAADWMHRFPDEIHRAVLINTSSRLNNVFRRINPLAITQLLLTAVIGMEKREATMVDWVCNDTALRTQLKLQWIGLQKEKPVQLQCILTHLLAAARFSPAEISHPLLLLASEKDRLVSVECTKTLAAYWHKTPVIHPEAGHDLPYESPEWIIQKINEWLNYAE